MQVRKTICPIICLLAYSLSFFIGYGEESVSHWFMYLKAGLIAGSALLFTFLCIADLNERERRRLSVLSLIVFIWQVLLLIAVGKTVIYIRDYPAIVNSLFWIPCSLLAFIKLRQSFVRGIRELLADHDTILLMLWASILSVVVIILSVEPNGIRFTWDSNELYGFTYRLSFESLYDFKQTMFHNHVSIIYSYLIVFMKYLFNDLRLAFFILNAGCIISASFGTIFLLRSLVLGKKVATYVLGAAMFVLSPWVCGLSTYHKYDYYIWCLFPLLIYLMMQNNMIGFVTIGAMITFSKSTGLVVFGSVCVAMVVIDLAGRIREGQSIKVIITGMLKTVRYWYCLLVAVVFFLYFEFAISAETQLEDGAIGIWPPHVFHQLKLFMLANFVWIFVILTILCIISVFISKKAELSYGSKRVIMILLISDMIFIVFNLVYITYRLPRYLNSHIAVLYLCSAVYLIGFEKKSISYAIMSALSVIMVIGSFKTIDPVSKAVFNEINVGDHSVIDFEMGDQPSFEDSIVYNREYYSYEVLLNKALSYVIDNRKDEDEMMFSLGNDPITWGFSGGRYSYAYNNEKKYFEEFYDADIMGLANGYDYSYYDLPNMIPFNMRYVFPQEDVTDAVKESSSKEFYYMYMPTLNASKEKKIYDNFEVLEDREFSFRGWKMNCIRFRANTP